MFTTAGHLVVLRCHTFDVSTCASFFGESLTGFGKNSDRQKQTVKKKNERKYRANSTE